MNKYIILIAILAVIIVILAAVLFWPMPKKSVVIEKPLADIEILNVKSGHTVSSPLKITGIVRVNGWNGFEGQVGTVHVMDASNNELAVGVLKATTDWMALPTSFEANVTFAGISGQAGSLVFKNENASGDPVRDKTFILPIIFQ